MAAGFIADRRGHKLALEIGLAASALAFLLAWGAPNATWYYLVFLSLGVAQGIVIVSGVLISMEFSAPADRPTYIGISNTTQGIGSVVAPLVGGTLAAFSYSWLFALSAAFSLITVVVLRKVVQEPRHVNAQQD